jgi:hypothetical protein
MKKTLLLLTAVLWLSAAVSAQVLGPCGAPQQVAKEGVAAKPASQSDAPELAISPVPLPGQRAIDFELTAVVGDDIKNIKLSDYQGKWRVVCFFPAAFTFV